MNRKHRHGGLGAAVHGLASALQWRLWLLWILATLLPTLVVTLPLWSALDLQFGWSVHARDIAAGRDLPLLLQGLVDMAEHQGWLPGSLGLSTVLALLLSPWLTGMVVASMRAGRRLGFGELVRGGVAEYWRLLRMLLWSILPLGLALMAGSAASAALQHRAEGAVLASEVESAARAGLVVLAVLFVLAHATVEAGRGWLGADLALRSVVKAWWRGLKLLLRRPLATLLVYLVASIAGYGLALLFAWLRVRVDGVGGGAALLGFLAGQGIVAMLALGRIARLYGLGALAADRMRRA
jgi:hypothetical protein